MLFTGYTDEADEGGAAEEENGGGKEEPWDRSAQEGAETTRGQTSFSHIYIFVTAVVNIIKF